MLSSKLASSLSPSILDTYSLSSLECKALYMVISFLVPWSICFSFPQVHFKNIPEYLTRGTTQVFIPFIRFLLYSLVSSSVHVLLKFSFQNFSIISTFWWCQILIFSSSFKSPQVSRTLLSILAILSNAVIWIVSIRPLTSKSSRPFNNPLVIVSKAPITIGTIVTFVFHSFFSSLAKSRYLSFFSHSFSFILWSAGTAKSTILQILLFFFLLIIRSSGLLVEIKWFVCYYYYYF